MVATLYRPTWAEIDLAAIGYNIKQIKKTLSTGTEIMAVVKANGYGHGSVEIARKALASGAKALAVALLEEALVLRRAGITAPILVLGWVDPKDSPVAASHHITLTFFQEEWLEEVGKISLTDDLKVHMKWDTGMGRIGIRTEQDLSHVLTALKQIPHVKLTGVFTHFASADEENLTYYHGQTERFSRLLDIFQKEWQGAESIHIHTGNSAAAIRFPEQMQHYIRFGIAMYGQYPSPWVKSQKIISLKPAFSLYSQLTHVKRVSKGAKIGYGSTYTFNEEGWVGTVPIGYGDGWSRELQDFHVLVDGKKCPIIGRICMDQMMIRLDQSYPIGTKVTLIGKDQQEEIEVDDIADYLGTIPYEVTCMLNERIPRKYI
ncbi:MAG TPA: alanine racemase [Cerasibacillus sp.]|uniref:alanine racemase n=1 Tax=Cerasibacillus sp. TaxID=2498711 RepID=UPI002F3F62B7